MLTITVSGETGEGKSTIAALIALALSQVFINCELRDSDEPDAKNLFKASGKPRTVDSRSPRLSQQLEAVRLKVLKYPPRQVSEHPTGIIIDTRQLNRALTEGIARAADIEIEDASESKPLRLPEYYRCRRCHLFHVASYTATCAERLTSADVNRRHGPNGWNEVAHPPTSQHKPEYYRCGICDHYHARTWNGDCREDKNRLTLDDVNTRHGEHGWDEVDMPS